MSKLVNYKKRSVALPPGCKNLVDVLHPQKSVGLVAGNLMACHWGKPAVGKLADISKFLDRLRRSSALMAHLWIVTTDSSFGVGFDNFRFANSDPMPQSTTATVLIGAESRLEPALRDFYRRRGLNIPDMSGPLPSTFLKGIPVLPNWQIDPLPKEIPALALLVTDMFRDVCGLNESSELRFEFGEQIAPPGT